MKNYFLSLLTIGALVISSCSNDNDEDIQEQIVPVNNEIISLFEEEPDPLLDNSNRGLYHGVFSTSDLSLKGKIYVNIVGGDTYKAEIKLRDGELLEFTANATNDLDHISFSNERGSFTLNITDIDHVTATNVTLDTKEGYIQVFKDRSNQRVIMALGTFVEDANPSFTGNWDVVTTGIAHPNDDFGDGFETIQTMVVSINGNMFMDTNPDIEGWDDTLLCGLGLDSSTQAGLTANYFEEPGVMMLEGYNQLVTYNGVDINWNGSVLPPSQDPADFGGCESNEGTWSTADGLTTGTFTFDM